MSKRIEILEVLVGSRAHGIARVNSDEDIRGVFITPTSELLKIGSNEPQKGALSSNGDNYKYEIAHFLQLAIKSNPSILEIFKAPIRKNVESCAAGIYSQELRDLFPHVWSSIGVRNAFKGYSHDQQKRMFDERDQLSKRRFKYAVAHIRVLLQGIELLREGDFSVAIKENYYWADYNTDLSVPVASETDNDGIITVSYTHLTLPTIYSV